ncbi:hypothetical protein GCM10010387_24260 [Streptomyces inusitatus]|uniref:Uncharacterized protein n=1 Tax=Streptomyces inusitatus TaxID=68221 RepID=A0A918Q0W6_9ACTN|nr:hypothetical protein [Streptomyces inusitatus]GGZ29953.1 hypothetical protein GCM10010387_24260 [Streptomyces inusitatus]
MIGVRPGARVAAGMPGATARAVAARRVPRLSRTAPRPSARPAPARWNVMLWTLRTVAPPAAAGPAEHPAPRRQEGTPS